jgi:hypothetical protein
MDTIYDSFTYYVSTTSISVKMSFKIISICVLFSVIIGQINGAIYTTKKGLVFNWGTYCGVAGMKKKDFKLQEEKILR